MITMFVSIFLIWLIIGMIYIGLNLGNKHEISPLIKRIIEYIITAPLFLILEFIVLLRKILKW